MEQSHRLHCEKGPAEAVLPSPTEEVQPATGAADTVLPSGRMAEPFYSSAIIESVFCTSITVWFSSATKSDHRRLWRVLRTAERIIGTTLPTLELELYLSKVSKRSGKSLWTPHIQHTPSLNCYHLVDTTELRVSERTDTDTVSSLRQSIS